MIILLLYEKKNKKQKTKNKKQISIKAGIGWGYNIGAEITDYVIILNSVEAIQSFITFGQLTAGAEIDVAFGPVGRSGSAAVSVSEKVIQFNTLPYLTFSNTIIVYSSCYLNIIFSTINDFRDSLLYTLTPRVGDFLLVLL
jgi:hypothetical protein